MSACLIFGFSIAVCVARLSLHLPNRNPKAVGSSARAVEAVVSVDSAEEASAVAEAEQDNIEISQNEKRRILRGIRRKFLCGRLGYFVSDGSASTGELMANRFTDSTAFWQRRLVL